MASNIFEVVKENFFTPLATRNKRYNYDLLMLIYNKLSLDNLQVLKEDIVSWIYDYMQNSPIELFDDETEAYQKDLRAFSNSKVNYFVKCGWLIEDYESLHITYQLDENGIKLLKSLENIVKDDSKPLEFSGYVYNIYNNLYHFNFDHAVDIVEQASAANDELKAMLRGLNVNIKKYLTKLLMENQAMPKQIMETIFFEYQKKVVLKAFKNFREKDNPSRYKLFIENKINELFKEEQFNKLIKNYLEVKYDGNNDEEYLIEARSFFEIRLNNIRDLFEEIEEYIQMLDRKNTKYISTAQARLNFLLNEEYDVDGRIIESLKGLSNVENDFYEKNSFDLFVGQNIDEYSLYKPNNVQKRTVCPLEIEEFDDDLAQVNEQFARLFKDNAYSVSEINKYVLKQLANRSSLHLKDFVVSSFEDVLKIFLLQIYSQNNSVDYRVVFLQEEVCLLDYCLTDCLVSRREDGTKVS